MKSRQDHNYRHYFPPEIVQKFPKWVIIAAGNCFPARERNKRRIQFGNRLLLCDNKQPRAIWVITRWMPCSTVYRFAKPLMGLNFPFLDFFREPNVVLFLNSHNWHKIKDTSILWKGTRWKEKGKKVHRCMKNVFKDGNLKYDLKFFLKLFSLCLFI